MRLKNFGKTFREKKLKFNEKSSQLCTLEKDYCKNITPKSYQITNTVLDGVISKIQNNKAPRTD